MIVPTLSAWVKQRDELAVDPSGEIRPLMEIAPMTRETKIGFVVGSVMLFGDDVFNMECDERQFVLMESAVFTAVPCAVTHQTA